MRGLMCLVLIRFNRPSAASKCSRLLPQLFSASTGLAGRGDGVSVIHYVACCVYERFEDAGQFVFVEVGGLSHKVWISRALNVKRHGDQWP
jgi:hypothetical protein